MKPGWRSTIKPPARAVPGSFPLLIRAALRYPLPALVGTLPAYGRVVLTATPGLTWTISCNGKGATPAEAEKNFAFWNQEIDAIIASFRFLSAKPSPAAVPAAAAKAPSTTPDKK